MRNSRLFEMLIFLVDKKKTTAQTLANKFEVSIRTIYRDIDNLVLSGVPICTQKGKNGGIFIDDKYTIDRAAITNEDQIELRLALRALESIPNLNSIKSGGKLSSFASNSEALERDIVSVDLSPWKSLSSIESANYETIYKAIEDHKIVKIEYVGTNMMISMKLVDPVQLLFKHKDWYLVGYCKKDYLYKMYKLCRIISLSVTNQIYENHTLPSPVYSNDYINLKRVERIKLEFEIEVAYKVLDDFDQDCVEVLDSVVYVTGQLDINEWLLSTLMSYGDKVNIHEPKSLRKVLAEKLLLAYKHHLIE